MILVFILALSLRVLHILEDSQNPFFQIGGLDTAIYIDRALGWMTGQWPLPVAFEQPPLYSIWLGELIRLFARETMDLKIVHAVMGSVNGVLLFFIAKKTFPGSFIPLCSALLYAFNGTLIYFDTRLLSTNLEIFLQLSVILLLLSAVEHRSIVWWIAAGIATGLCVVNRGGILFVLPFIMVWLVCLPSWHSEISKRPERDGMHLEGKGAKAKRVLAILLPIVLIVSPQTWHNVRYDAPKALPPFLRPPPDTSPLSNSEAIRKLLAGDFVPLTSEVGFNFAHGNQWEKRGITDPNHPLCIHNLDSLSVEPFKVGILTASGRNRYLLHQALRRIREAPLRWIQLMGEKTFQILHGHEIPRNANIYACRQYSVVLSTLLWHKGLAFPSGILIPLGLLGIIFGLSLWRRHFVILSFIVGKGLFVLLFFVTARFRAPLIPLLSIYAAYTLQTFFLCIRQGQIRKLYAPASVLLGLLILANLPVDHRDEDHGAYEYVAAGDYLNRHGKPTEAIRFYYDAVRRDAAMPGVHLRLAELLYARNEKELAEEQVREAIRLYPKFAQAHFTLGWQLAKEEKTREAMDHLAEGLRIWPFYEPGRVLLQQLQWKRDR